MERAPILLLLSPNVNRSRLPSGDQRGQNAVLGRLTSLRGSVPSLFARYKSRSRTYLPIPVADACFAPALASSPRATPQPLSRLTAPSLCRASAASDRSEC